MLNGKPALRYAVLLFVAAELVLGILVQTTSGTACKVVSFSSVVLACLFYLLLFEKNCKYIFTQIGLILTVCADVFLVLLDARQKLVAMIFFSLAQLAYGRRIYLYSEGDGIRRAHIIARGSAVALSLLITLIVLGEGCDSLSLVSMFYYANLLTNVVFAFLDGRRSLPFAIGLLLFSMCDALIGLSLLDAYLPIAEGSLIYRITHTGINLAWMFYVPSQTLIAVSTCRFKSEN